MKSETSSCEKDTKHALFPLELVNQQHSLQEEKCLSGASVLAMLKASS
ncbi:hypothetical protein RV02_GL004010 [Enterococcus gilvus]|nr:hypothetical protein RV02_GL004010 [Enterococcus gilvus]